MIGIGEALRLVLASVPAMGREVIPARRGAGRVLAEDLIAREDTPFEAMSAMDGYAVRAEELPATLRLSPPAVHAGEETGPTLAAGQARRVMTGARIPEGSDAVVMQEEVLLLDGGEEIRIQRGAKASLNIRPAGDAIRAGETVLRAGETIRARSLPLALASGAAAFTVAKMPRVGVATTGDELVEIGLPMRSGGVRETIRSGLLAAVAEAGCEAVDLGILPDDPDEIETRLAAALSLDALVTIGGASVGDHDFTRQVAERLGMDLKFWKVEMKPGKPSAFGLIEKRPVFLLPGNPVSAFVVFEIFVRPALRAMLGAKARFRPWIPLPLASGVERHPGRAEFLRARILWGEMPLRAEALPDQGSHQIGGLGRAEALLFVPRDAEKIPVGEVLPAILLGAEETDAEPPYLEGRRAH